MHFFSFMFSLDWLGIRWVYLYLLLFFSHVRYLKENGNSAMFSLLDIAHDFLIIQDY